MGFLDKLFGKRKKQPPAPPEQGVLVCFDYGSTDLSRLFEVEDQLEQVLDATGVGELDGNEIAIDGSDATLFMYGPDADALLAAIRPTLEAVDFMKGARVKLQHDPQGDDFKEVEVVLDT